MSFELPCPLCGGNMSPHELESKNTGNGNKTYMWVCDECPGLLIEWHGDYDTEAMVKYLAPKNRITNSGGVKKYD